MSDSESEDEKAVAVVETETPTEASKKAVTFRSLGIKETLCEAIEGLGEWSRVVEWSSGVE
jgi:hypothetical protein